jgi:mRNA interferase YafQ
MYKISTTNQFEKDIKKCNKRHLDMSLLLSVINNLEKKGQLDKKYKSHKLSGSYADFWECHIKPDWLLIWLQDDDEKSITLTRTGTHSDLF